MISTMLKTISPKLRNSKCGQGIFFGFQPPTFNVENKRPKLKKKISAMPKTLSTNLKNSKCSQGNLFCFQPPIFGAKSRRLKAKK
jgi:hypothetical protein